MDRDLAQRLLAFIEARDARWAALDSTVPADAPGGYMDCVDREVAARTALSEDDLETLRRIADQAKPWPKPHYSEEQRGG